MLSEVNMDTIDRRLINLLQKGLPLDKNPYGLLAEELGITRSEVLERICDLSGRGYIRRLGGVFNNSGMG